jgi:hypothetical protein
MLNKHMPRAKSLKLKRAIENFWTKYHTEFAKAVVLWRLLRAQNENNVKAFLDRAVANGKITGQKETNIINLWEALHPFVSASAATTTTP